MTEQFKRIWGEYIVTGKTKILKVKPDKKLSLQFHNYRDEFWKILSGKGKVTIGEKIFEAKKDDTFTIPRKVNHRIEAYTEGLEFLEIATGEVDEEDIVRLEDDYKRIKQTKEKIVIASGYFDPIHIGHIEYLQLSKKLCGKEGKLIVILNNDHQCILKKGKFFMPAKERKIILEELKCVDEVFESIDKDESVCKSIKAITEAHTNCEIIFAKGGDRIVKNIPGSEPEMCKKYNIKIVQNLGEKIQSSSNLTKIK